MTRDLRFQRVIDAPPEEVFPVFIRPDGQRLATTETRLDGSTLKSELDAMGVPLGGLGFGRWRSPTPDRRHRLAVRLWVRRRLPAARLPKEPG